MSIASATGDVGACVASLLGPVTTVKAIPGADKASATLTADPAAIVEACTNWSRPASATVGRLLLDACAGQEAACGTGVTTLVVLTAALVQRCGGVLEAGTPKAHVWAGLRQACRVVAGVVGAERVKLRLPSAPRTAVGLHAPRCWLEWVASLVQHGDPVAHGGRGRLTPPAALAVEAASLCWVGGKPPAVDIKRVTVRRRRCVAPSRAFAGVCVDVAAVDAATFDAVGGEVAGNVFVVSGNVLRTAASTGDLVPHRVVTTPAALASVHRAAGEWVAAVVAHLVGLDVRLLLALGSIDDGLRTGLVRAGIASVGGVPGDEAQAVARLTGSNVAASVMSDAFFTAGVCVEVLSPPCFPRGLPSEDVSASVKVMGSTSAAATLVLTVGAEAVGDGTPVTALVCGSSVAACDAAARQTSGCLARLQAAVADVGLLPGGGHTALAAAAGLREAAEGPSDNPFLGSVLLAAGDAMESLVFTSLFNLGLSYHDAIAAVTQWRSGQRARPPVTLPERFFEDGDAVDASIAYWSKAGGGCGRLGVADSVRASKQAMMSAFRLAEVLLRTDGILSV